MILETKDLGAGYNNKKIISDLTACLDKPGIIGLIGPNGAGKSTVLKTIAGILPKLGGKVLILDRELEEMSANEKAKQMAVMLTTRKDAEYTTCYDAVCVGRYPYTGMFGTLTDDDKAVVQEVMELTDTWELREREITKISDGQKQRVLLARALVQEPKILILDEPTSFLDVGYQLEFMTILKRMVREKNMAVLMSIHELDLAYKTADEVICITAEGQVDRIGNPKQVLDKDYIGQLFNIKHGSYSLGECGFSFKEETESEEAASGQEISKETANEQAATNEAATDTICANKSTHFIMVQGTMSSAGKSLVAAGLCRIFAQDGYRVMPFKSQNMALNSYITEDGLEMGRAQVMQAECCKVKPSVYMNPILLKPTDDKGSQVIVNGEVVGNMRAREYFAYKKKLIPDIKKAVEKLSEQADIIVIEGAGSPAEINLKENDIVNMGMAKLVDAPVLLVGDIDRGGVFAQLLGTLELLEEDEKKRVKGLIVNKFRGDRTILDPGIDMLYERGKVPVAGVLPYMDVNLEDEDSLTERFERKGKGIIDIAVIRLPHISNFTDFDVFEQVNGVSVRYVKKTYDLGTPDVLILPGSKNTIADMRWLRESGMEVMIKKLVAKDVPVIGICGGYQMLGRSICDPDNVEGGGEISGLDLLPVETVLAAEKARKQTEGVFEDSTGILSQLKGKAYSGYEIHMGVTKPVSEDMAKEDRALAFTDNNTGYCYGNVYGTYIHGVFDNKQVVQTFINIIARAKGIGEGDELKLEGVLDFKEFKEKEYDRLADIMRQHMDMDYIYEIMGITRN